MRGSESVSMADVQSPAAGPRPRWPYLIGCGLAMGSADVVPGVSGGSMAFILGIYSQLLEAVAGFDLQLLALLRRGQWAAAAALVFVTRVPVTMPHDAFTLFWSGAVVIMAMILPGVSGSFLLLVLGQYQHVMEAVKGLDLGTLVPFALGCATGLVVFVRLLRWLLARWHGQTVALLVGFMAGSLWKIWPFRIVLETTTNAKGKLIVLRDALAAPRSGAELAVALLLGGVAVALVLLLEAIQQRAGVAEMGV